MFVHASCEFCARWKTRSHAYVCQMKPAARRQDRHDKAAPDWRRRRQEANRLHYQNRLRKQGRRDTRATTLPCRTASTKASATCLRRSKHLTDGAQASMENEGWQVFRNVWEAPRAQAVCRLLREGCRHKSPDLFQTRMDCKLRLSIPMHLFQKQVADEVVSVTRSLGVSDLGRIDVKTLRCIVAHPGAKRQADHVDSKDRTFRSVLHIMSRRFFHVGGEHIKLNAGDVVVMRGGVCHAGAAHDLKRPSYLVHVPVGKEPQNTSPC